MLIFLVGSCVPAEKEKPDETTKDAAGKEKNNQDDDDDKNEEIKTKPNNILSCLKIGSELGPMLDSETEKANSLINKILKNEKLENVYGKYEIESF